MNLLGIDIGGTKIAVCIADETGALRWSERMPTTSDQPERVIQRMLDLARSGLAQIGITLSDIDAVGLSCPGPASVKKGLMLAPPNMLGWVNVPVQQWIADALGRPVRMNNDANACALAEYTFGSHQGVSNLAYLTMSTGIGAGFVVDGRIVQGVSDLAGEVGHHVLDRHGPDCPCGQKGCWEMYCGGMNVANRVRAHLQTSNQSSLILDRVGGDYAKIDFRMIREAAADGDPYALTVWDEFIERLAQGIGTVIQFMNPEVIVMGTIAIHAGDFLLSPLRDRLPHYAWRHGREVCELVPSTLGSSIGELSAIALALEHVRLMQYPRLPGS